MNAIEPTCRDCLIDFLKWYALCRTKKTHGYNRLDAGYSVDAYLATKAAEG